MGRKSAQKAHIKDGEPLISVISEGQARKTDSYHAPAKNRINVLLTDA